jgi:hypothetical protein
VTGTALANTAHNWTVCQYTDQDGNTGNSLPSFAGNPGAVATITDRLDMPNGTWFAPLVSGDSGIQKLTQMQCDVPRNPARGHYGCPVRRLYPDRGGMMCSLRTTMAG